MAASEIVIRDGGISERVMSDVREVTIFGLINRRTQLICGG